MSDPNIMKEYRSRLVSLKPGKKGVVGFDDPNGVHAPFLVTLRSPETTSGEALILLWLDENGDLSGQTLYPVDTVIDFTADGVVGHRLTDRGIQP